MNFDVRECTGHAREQKCTQIFWDSMERNKWLWTPGRRRWYNIRTTSKEVGKCALFMCTFVLYCTVLYYCHRVSTQLQLTNISYQLVLVPFT